MVCLGDSQLTKEPKQKYLETSWIWHDTWWVMNKQDFSISSEWLGVLVSQGSLLVSTYTINPFSRVNKL